MTRGVSGTAEDDNEARAILDLCEGSKHKAFAMVEGQLTVLVLRTQVVLSLSGIVITVTGFSGRAIAETGLLARVSIISGLFLVLFAAAIGVWGVLRLKWFTQTIEPDIVVTLRAGIALRNQKSRFLPGFTLYCVAIAQLLAR